MAAAGKPPSNVGCVVAIVALPIVVLLGVVIGTVLRDDDDAVDEVHDTLETGEHEGVSWKVDAVTDVDGQTCIFLYEDDAADPLNGTCDLQPQDVTYGDQTIVFGRADRATEVTVELSDDQSVDIATQSADGVDGRFYVEVVPGDVNAVALTG